ncbi:UDENN domain-containing protein [Entamoeba marina]
MLYKKKIIEGCIVFQNNTNNISYCYPLEYLYPQHFYEYCVCDNVQSSLNIVIFTDDKNTRKHGYLYPISDTLSLLVFSDLLWYDFYEYFMNQLVYLYDNNFNVFESTIQYFNLYKVSIATKRITLPVANIDYQQIPNDCFVHTNKIKTLLQFNHNTLRCIFATLLNERKIIVVGDDKAFVSIFVMVLLESIQPFEWHHLLITSLPHSMESLLHSPIPFLIGVERKQLSTCFSCDIVIDINNFSIQSTDVEATQADIDSFPKTMFKDLCDSFEEIKTYKEVKQEQSIKFALNNFFSFITKGIAKLVQLQQTPEGIKSTFDIKEYESQIPNDGQEFIKKFIKTAFFDTYLQKIEEDQSKYPIPSKLKPFKPKFK